MARQPKVWWNAQKGTWCSDIGGKRQTLAKGKGSKQKAEEKLNRLLAEQALLADVNGSVTVARLCEEFLTDTQENLEARTYYSYRYACQKFVDEFGERDAHSLEPLDITRFSAALKRSVGDSTRGLILRSIRRCVNWGVEHRLIPPHRLGRIRIPQAKTRDRFVTDDEFQTMLRATNSRNGHRTGAAFRRLLLAMDWTLCRPGELARLKWEHISWEQEVAILPDHKTKRTGKPKIIALIPKMQRLLRCLQQSCSSEFCFLNSRGEPWTINAIDHRMNHVKDRSGLKDVVP
ncbi:MAG: tyrosine-type recombinase/integrase [Planctomycetaceae bacterium]|nr:tyrosine-type recombinase/integrase [Planctomycetales bacterium]MCB9922591.1 tyrosine-type recombinase/integrase [Planctomycetaceae bacterium]